MPEKIWSQSMPSKETPLLKKRHLEIRLKFAKDILKKSDKYWNTILWSDETKIEVLGQKTEELFGENVAKHSTQKTRYPQ